MNRLDRYVAMAYNFGISPVILITKIELCENASALLDEACARFPFVDVHAVSVVGEMNLEALDRYLKPDTTIAIMGSSGVGKSTLINRLLEKKILETGSIREDDGRGRHTTTSRSLHRTPTGVWLMDTPGIRGLALWDGEEGVETLFGDIETLALQCKFTDCQHEHEPQCRIREALEANELDEDRWQSYLKLGAETAFERRKADKSEASKQREAWKKMSKSIRQKNKLNGKIR